MPLCSLVLALAAELQNGWRNLLTGFEAGQWATKVWKPVNRFRPASKRVDQLRSRSSCELGHKIYIYMQSFLKLFYILISAIQESRWINSYSAWTTAKLNLHSCHSERHLKMWLEFQSLPSYIACFWTCATKLLVWLPISFFSRTLWVHS